MLCFIEDLSELGMGSVQCEVPSLPNYSKFYNGETLEMRSFKSGI